LGSGSDTTTKHFPQDADLMFDYEGMVPTTTKMIFHIPSSMDEREKYYSYDYDEYCVVDLQGGLF
jgi:hypothetical protein